MDRAPPTFPGTSLFSTVLAALSSVSAGSRSFIFLHNESADFRLFDFKLVRTSLFTVLKKEDMLFIYIYRTYFVQKIPVLYRLFTHKRLDITNFRRNLISQVGESGEHSHKLNDEPI